MDREKITMEQPWTSGRRSVKGSLQGWCHPAFFCYTGLPIAIMDFHCVPGLPSLLKMGAFLNPYGKMQNTYDESKLIELLATVPSSRIPRRNLSGR